MRHCTLLEKKLQLLFVNFTLREKWATLGRENLAPCPVLLLRCPSSPSQFCTRILLFPNFWNIWKAPNSNLSYMTDFVTELIKIKNAHMGKVLQFCEKYTNQCKIAGNIALFVGKSVSKFKKDSSRVIMVVFLKHNSQCYWKN